MSTYGPVSRPPAATEDVAAPTGERIPLITQHGRTSGVVVDLDSYQALLRRVAELEQRLTGQAPALPRTEAVLPPVLEPTRPVLPPADFTFAPSKPAPMVQGRPPRSEAGDVRRLFNHLGVPGFQYREVASFERGAIAAAEARLSRDPADSDLDFEIVVDGSAAAASAAVPQRPPRNSQIPFTIALVSLKPGVGKSTIAANLASALAQEARRSIVLDLDPRNLVTGLFSNPAARFGLINATHSLDHLQWMQSGASCIPFGQCEADALLKLEAALASNPRWVEQRLLAMAPTDCDVWVLNTPGNDGRLLQQALALADAVVVVVTPDASASSTVLATDAVLKQHLEKQGRPPAMYLVNRFDSRRAIDRGSWALLRGQLGQRLLPGVVHEDIGVERAGQANQLIVRAAAESQVVADLGGLAEWMLTRKGSPKQAATGT